jgi:glycosyltransferase involved in cell wall biosynthesis
VHIGILTVAIHTHFLRNGMLGRGHRVCLIGPDTSEVVALGDEETHLFPGLSYPTYPRVKISLPGSPRRMIRQAPQVDVIHGQTNTHMVYYGAWMRQMFAIPVLHTHTVHIPTHSHFILSDRLYANDYVRQWCIDTSLGLEHQFADAYNQGDGLIVQSRHFVQYWRDRGVTVPIHVVGRPIDPRKFDAQPNYDPFPEHFKVGKRIIVVSRHDREKNLGRLLEIFAHGIAPNDPEATLTLVGDGHGHFNLCREADRLPHSDRIFMPGEVAHDQLVNWYAHADLFGYTSLSETFGNVVGEALWSGLPVVALNDHMGVAGQVVDRVNGALIDPDPVPTANQRFAMTCLALLANRDRRREMGEAAANLARRTAHPDAVLSRFESIYAESAARCKAEVVRPLVTRSRAAQYAAWTRAARKWAFWNGLLVFTSSVLNGLGGSRVDGDSQHARVELELRANGGKDRGLVTRHGDEQVSRPAA